MNRSASASALAAALALGGAACGSVDVPHERFYRLALPEPQAAAPGRQGILRVADLQVGTALDTDCLLRAAGLRLEPRPLDRWVAPLDRLVTDALVLGLSRTRVCALVKGGGDPGAETWTLHGRIVEFAEARGAAGAEARVALELWLVDRDRVAFHDEFAAVVPLAAAGPDGAVAALSQGLQQVVGALIDRMAGQGLVPARPPAPAR